MGLKWSGDGDGDGEQREPENIEPLPENARASAVFYALATQWRVVSGMAGERATGIDYASLPAVMDMLNIRAKYRRDTFERLRVIENAALEEMNRTR